MTKNDTIYIGIDPDVDRNGVAVLKVESRKMAVVMLPFYQTLEFIAETHKKAISGGNGFKVIVEAGWMNHGNYHLRKWDGRESSAAKGVDQGRNEQVSRLIGEYCEHAGVPYEFKRPLPKCWMGHDRKITREELEQVTGQNLGRLNQEGRDAALLAWDKAGLPIRARYDSAKMDGQTAKMLYRMLKNK
jgi:hypothetical protein